MLFLNIFRQNALLATISEKDANIALLELSPTVGSDDEVKKFKAEKDKLVNELKEQVTDAGTTDTVVLRPKNNRESEVFNSRE